MRIGIIGDIHRSWTHHDVAWFNQSGYDGLLICGDLADFVHRMSLGVACSLAELTIPAIMIPGNHDATNIAQFGADFSNNSILRQVLNRRKQADVDQLQVALGPVAMAGYSTHRLGGPRGSIFLIAGRPHSMGGSRLNFGSYLAQRFSIDSLAESGNRICELVDQAGDNPIIFLAHNGPTGLGDQASSIWGNDFRAGAGDFGDADLRAGIDHAIASGRQVLAVVAGHMHHQLKHGGQRTWHVRKDGILYVNAARVPRCFKAGNGRHVRHHVCLEISDGSVDATEVLVESPGSDRAY